MRWKTNDTNLPRTTLGLEYVTTPETTSGITCVSFCILRSFVANLYREAIRESISDGRADPEDAPRIEVPALVAPPTNDPIPDHRPGVCLGSEK